jgi:hypothetical protein
MLLCLAAVKPTALRHLSRVTRRRVIETRHDPMLGR